MLIRCEPSTLAALLLLAAAPLVLTACEPPASAYRRSVLRPPLLGAQGAVPVPEGKTHLTGALVGRTGDLNEAAVAAGPGIQQSPMAFAAEGRYGLFKHLNVGAQLAWSPAGLAQPAAEGVPELDREALGAFSLRASAMLHTGLEPGFFAGLRLDAGLASAPWAVWARQPMEEDGVFKYKIASSGRHESLANSSTLVGGYTTAQRNTFFLALKLENTLSNSGFSDDGQPDALPDTADLEDPTITRDTLDFGLTAGAQGRLGERLLVGGLLMFSPRGGLGLGGTLGVEL